MINPSPIQAPTGDFLHDSATVCSLVGDTTWHVCDILPTVGAAVGTVHRTCNGLQAPSCISMHVWHGSVVTMCPHTHTSIKFMERGEESDMVYTVT